MYPVSLVTVCIQGIGYLIQVAIPPVEVEIEPLDTAIAVVAG